MVRADTTSFTVLDFLEWDAASSLSLTPKFQRRHVWKNPAKAYLIDTILRGMPIPPIYLRTTQSEKGDRVIREVVDGQQRLTAIIEFYKNQFPLPRSFDPRYAGKSYDKLSPELQDSFKEYSFVVEILKGASDKEVLEVFARVNTYSIPLNDQELRHGKYFGPFREVAESIAHEYLEFWRRNKIFSETGIARMSEVELVSELMIMALAGLQDKKKSIDKFYEEYDATFKERGTVEKRVREVLDETQAALSEVLPNSEFSRVPLFYSLFAAVYHRRFGLRGEAISPKRPLTAEDRRKLTDTVIGLSEVLSADKKHGTVPLGLQAFVTASLRQTDNLGPRQVRFNTIYSKAFG